MMIVEGGHILFLSGDGNSSCDMCGPDEGFGDGCGDDYIYGDGHGAGNVPAQYLGDGSGVDAWIRESSGDGRTETTDAYDIEFDVGLPDSEGQKFRQMVAVAAQKGLFR